MATAEATRIDAFRRRAELCRVLTDPKRLLILDALRNGERSVGELADALGASQQNVSKHRTVLAEAGILGRRKEGTHVYYTIADESMLGLRDEVCGSVQEQLRMLTVLVAGGER